MAEALVPIAPAGEPVGCVALSSSSEEAERHAPVNPNLYCIYRMRNFSSRPDQPTWYWHVRVVRQGTSVQRAFAHGAYGGEQAALAMAIAYRDAALLLLPPQTTAQSRTRLRRRNTSGTAGVRRVVRPNCELWQATYTIGCKTLSKMFSVGRYGEETAYAMAVAQRQKYLVLHQDAFLTAETQATNLAEDRFSDLLRGQAETPLAPFENIDKAVVEERVAALEKWFDGLRPRHVHVTMASNFVPSESLRVSVSDGGWPAQSKKKAVHVGTRTMPQGLDMAWSFLRSALTEMHDDQCWLEFEARHRAEFFAYLPSRGFHTRYRYDTAEFARRRRPPASIASLLGDFQIP